MKGGRGGGGVRREQVSEHVVKAGCHGEEHSGGRTPGEAGLVVASAPRRPLDIWGTWSHFLELPFSDYLATLAVGSFASGGAGAEVKMSRCVSHKPNGRHDSSQTQKSKLGSFGKRRTGLPLSLRGLPQTSGLTPQKAAGNSTHEFTRAGGSSTPTRLTSIPAGQKLQAPLHGVLPGIPGLPTGRNGDLAFTPVKAVA